MKPFPVPGAALVAAFFLFAAPAPAAADDDAVAAVLERSVAMLRRDGRVEAGGAVVQRSELLAQFYERRAYRPAWSDPDSVAELVDAIGEAEAQGLEPEDYRLAAVVKRRAFFGDGAETAADNDLLLSSALIRLCQHVRYGKIPAEHFDANALPLRALHGVDPVAELDEAVRGGRIREFVESLEPQTTFYKRLMQGLATYRRIGAHGGWPVVGSGPALKPGETDPRMSVLRERLAVSGDMAAVGVTAAGDLYDPELVEGVRTFQARHGLAADGVLGVQTIAALNVPVAKRIDQIRATLERCRWLLRDLPERFVMVNAAGFRVLLIEDGQVVWRSRAIVGKPVTETPMFRADMRYVVLNPTWTVPQSIVRNEFVPALRRDPRYLAKKNIDRIGGEYVQRPGKDNALGRIKMMLPNPYSVYLHDTPSRSLFANTTRAFSHGCIRVEHPVELAALALDDPAWSVEALEAAIDTNRTRTINLRKPLAVLVMYWSVTVNREGTVEFLPDLYNRDAPLVRGLAGRPST
jgi:murein L,D-transpeptidase YcbB/YkuD